MQNAVIFGATSAIAADVAVQLARQSARLHLVGRNLDKLNEVAQRCRDAGAQVSTQQADFAVLGSGADVVARAIAECGELDLALIAHGDLGDQLESERDFSVAEKTLRVNLTSAIELLVPLANYFEGRRAGRIGVITSVAGERGRPRNYTYGAAKGGLNVYLQGLRSRLYASGVSITTLKLGPVDTPMTRNHEKNALFGKPEPVARDILRAMDRQRAEVFIPWFWGGIMPVVKAMPEWLFQRFAFLSGR
jgi:short-subunit dehydrogenase